MSTSRQRAAPRIAALETEVALMLRTTPSDAGRETLQLACEEVGLGTKYWDLTAAEIVTLVVVADMLKAPQVAKCTKCFETCLDVRAAGAGWGNLTMRRGRHAPHTPEGIEIFTCLRCLDRLGRNF